MGKFLMALRLVEERDRGRSLMDSWISFLLPNDEYKKLKMLYFFAEGAIMLFLFLIVMTVGNRYFNVNIEVILLASIALFLFYVCGRYIVSGIEYTDVATEETYRKAFRLIVIRTMGFVVIFLSLYIIFMNGLTSLTEGIELLGLLISVSLVWFLSSYISLKRSYKKNKELL